MADIQPPADDSSPSKSPPTIQSLRLWLPLYLKKADKTISHISRILSTPSGTDILLLTIAYSALATSSALSNLSLRRLHAHVLRLLSLATSLPANTTILLAPSTALPTPRLLQLSRSTKALSDLITDFRAFVRLWGLLGIWRWAATLLANPPQDRVLARIAWAQIAAGVGFQALENGAYLARKGVLAWHPRSQARAWVWSARFWATHVALELTRLAYLRSEKARKAKGKGAEGEGADEEGERAWMRDLISNLAYAPLTLHSSWEGGLVGNFWVGVLGTIAGTVKFKDLWRKTA